MNICKLFEVFYDQIDECETREAELRKEHASDLREIQQHYDFEFDALALSAPW